MPRIIGTSSYAWVNVLVIILSLLFLWFDNGKKLIEEVFENNLSLEFRKSPALFLLLFRLWRALVVVWKHPAASPVQLRN